MMSLLSSVFVTIIFCVIWPDNVKSVLKVSDLEEEASEIANRTYQENQTDLHRMIFRNYNTDERPVQDPETTVVVQVHPHITHISIDQYGQTMSLNGIMHMKWRDEKATWEPSERNGVKVTNVKQWEIWSPKIMVLNSAVGVKDYAQFSRNVYATLTSYGRAYSEVYVYPRFSLKIGCKFDYSTYPNDVQKCVLGIYTKYPLKQLNFTVSDFKNEIRQTIDWQNKLIISDWRVEKIESYSVFFADYRGTIDKWESSLDPNLALSILHTDITLRRYAPYYTSGIILPATVSFLVIISSFFVPSPKTAVYILIANLFLIGVFIGDLMFLLPPAIGSLPSVAYYFVINILLTVLSMFMQFWFLTKLRSVESVAGIPKKIALGKIFLVTFTGLNSLIPEKKSTSGTVDGTESITYELNWLYAVDAIRNFCALVWFLIMLLFFIYLLF